MKLRVCDSLDVPRMQEIFSQQGFDYEFPNVRMMVAAQVLEEDGQIVQAVLARPTVELYFLSDGRWRSPRWRLEAFRRIHESMRRELVGKGVRDVHCWLPPEIAKSFGGRLMRDFGWTKPTWANFTRPTAARET